MKIFFEKIQNQEKRVEIIYSFINKDFKGHLKIYIKYCNK